VDPITTNQETILRQPSKSAVIKKKQDNPIVRHEESINTIQLPRVNMPNYSQMSEEEQAQYFADFVTKFGILRKKWPDYHIPDITPDIPLEKIHAQYETYIRHIHISSNIGKYRVYLVVMWLVIQLICKKIGFEIDDYCEMQLQFMDEYDRLLIELGEKKFQETVVENGGIANNNNGWPIEINLFIMSLLTAGMLIGFKIFAAYLNLGTDSTRNIIRQGLSFLNGSPPQPGTLGPLGSTSKNGQIPSAIPGGNPLPSSNNPLGNFDIASLLSTFGSMFTRNQSPLGSQPQQQTSVPTNHQPLPASTRFKPAYDE
jgi:hypothetical protein